MHVKVLYSCHNLHIMVSLHYYLTPIFLTCTHYGARWSFCPTYLQLSANWALKWPFLKMPPQPIQFRM